MKRMALKGLQQLMIVLCMVCAAPSPAAAQQKTVTISGRVTGENGEPISGATVQVTGSKKGTTANADGSFTLSVPQNATLTVSAVGHTAQVLSVGNDNRVEVKLLNSKNEMEQVVVVGYGTQRKKDVTGAVVSVGEKALREVPVANLQGALQGRAAGLEVQTVGTNPGAGAQIRIRGTRSISGSNEPLIVLDGIPFDGSLNDINPGDVLSVDVLKDASATAIYGSRGANGVILVTTKRGKAGEARVSYNGFYGIGTLASKYPVYNADEYRAMREISPWSQGYMPEEQASISSGRTTDWQELMYQNSVKTDHNLSVSGGSNGSTFSLGGGYYNETAMLPGQEFTRYSLRATIDARVGKRIKVGLNTMNTLSLNEGTQFVYPMFPVLSLSPLMPTSDSTGRLLVSPTGNVDDRQTQYNPLLLKNRNGMWDDKIRRLRTFNSLYAEYQILPGLKYRANLGLSYAQQRSSQFRAGDDPLGINPSYFRPKQGNTASVNNGEDWNYTIENILSYDKTFGKHKLNFTGLYSFQEAQGFNTFVSKDSITENFISWYALQQSNPTPVPTLGGGEQRWALASYMARVNYAFDDRFLLTLTGRADGSSRLAPGNKWHYYPAVSAGWNITNERFMDRFKFLSNLKLRTGYGQTSNQAISPYASLGLVSNSNGVASPANVIRYNFGPTIVTGYNVVTLPNSSLGWEYTSTLNIGLDFGLFRNRITGAVEYYDSRTNDILYGVNLPVTSGVAGAFTTNVGSMSNRGIEFSLSSDNIVNPKGFNWSTDLNLFFNQNKLLRLTGNVERNIGNQLFVGYSMTSIFDFKKLGIWQVSEAEEAAKYGALPGQLKLADVNGVDASGKQTGKPDGRVDENDRHVIGNTDAKLQGGMTQRFTFRNWDLSAVLYGRYGGLLVSQIHQPLASYLTILNGVRSGIKVDYWTPTNPSNWFPMPQPVISPQTTAWSTLGYYDATFLQIRSINLGYTFSPNLIKKINAQSIRFYATVDNVAFLFSPYKRLTGILPEGTNLGNGGVVSPGNLRGGSNGTITISASTPQRRNFLIGANINF